jgi:hypothetical protein
MADLWPYAVVLLAGALPNNLFRSAAVLLARRIDERSELFEWIRICALTLLAAVVSRILTSPPAALAAIPLWIAIGAILVGTAVFFWRRILFVAILAGEAAFVLAAYGRAALSG